MTDHLARARRIIVKVGSRLLVDSATGALNSEWLASLVADMAALKNEGKEVLLVSSGAIALGRRALGLKHGGLRLEESQAAAAVGQVRLAQAYVEAFQRTALAVAQILLTLEDSEERRRYLNARETLPTLLALGAVPVINENDTVATAEIRYGDNDRLAARVVGMMEADCWCCSPTSTVFIPPIRSATQSAQHIPEVRAITPEIEAMAEGPVSGISQGGMESKIAAAKIATAAGAAVIIANGHVLHPSARHRLAGANDLFVPRVSPAAARKRWIAGGLSAQGDDRHRCGRGTRAAFGQEPAARGCHCGRRPVSNAANRDRRKRQWARTRARPRRLQCRGGAPSGRPPHRRDRDHSRLSWPRRDDPSR